VTSDPTKETDDVSGAARAVDEDASPVDSAPEVGLDPDATSLPPNSVAELAAACVRFVATRYGAMLDFAPETLSLLDQWLRDVRKEVMARPEMVDIAQSVGGAYLGEVIRRQFGARWFAEGDPAGWRLYLSTVYCAFNPAGMVREALSLEPAEGWHSHFELDPGERDAIEARLGALPQAHDDEYYAPSTRFDVLWIVVDALRAGLRSRGLDDVRFGPEDYD
jgi:hypothetical protein